MRVFYMYRRAFRMTSRGLLGLRTFVEGDQPASPTTAAASMPAAFVGGWMHTTDPVFKLILAAALVFGAWRLCFARTAEGKELRTPHPVMLAGLGLLIGFLSGLIGIGGRTNPGDLPVGNQDGT